LQVPLRVGRPEGTWQVVPGGQVPGTSSEHACGQGAKSQLGGTRPTADPSGQTLAMVSQAIGVGQGANSHFGPVRPTEVPSGHCIASSVHPTPGHSANSHFGPVRLT
jgi:hypothetical protein